MSALAEARATENYSLASEPRVVAGPLWPVVEGIYARWLWQSSTSLRKNEPRNHFTIGIVDDVTHTSLNWNPALRTEAEDVDTALLRTRRRRHGRSEQELD